MSTIPNSATSTTKACRVGKYKSNLFGDGTVDYWPAWFLLFLQAFRRTMCYHRKYTIGGNHIHIIRKLRSLGRIDYLEENFCDEGRRDMWACTNRETDADWQHIQKRLETYYRLHPIARCKPALTSQASEDWLGPQIFRSDRNLHCDDTDDLDARCGLNLPSYHSVLPS